LYALSPPFSKSTYRTFSRLSWDLSRISTSPFNGGHMEASLQDKGSSGSPTTGATILSTGVEIGSDYSDRWKNVTFG
jgi:hypothetical protein